MKEYNQDYEIIAAETYAVSDAGLQARIVLGFKETKFGPAYVTWDGGEDAYARRDYFWGHYFGNEREARADYHRRLLSHYEG